MRERKLQGERKNQQRKKPATNWSNIEWNEKLTRLHWTGTELFLVLLFGFRTCLIPGFYQRMNGFPVFCLQKKKSPLWHQRWLCPAYTGPEFQPHKTPRSFERKGKAAPVTDTWIFPSPSFQIPAHTRTPVTFSCQNKNFQCCMNFSCSCFKLIFWYF